LAAVKWLSKIEDYASLACPTCGSSLIEQLDPANTSPQDIQGRCRGCGAAIDGEKVAKLVVDAEFGAEAHVAAMEGNYDVISTCSECGLDTYVMNSDGVNGCFWCEDVVEGECARCYESLTPGNVSSESRYVCSRCNYLASKD
jgi:hypothetical protein